jgi:hypothetical protein
MRVDHYQEPCEGIRAHGDIPPFTPIPRILSGEAVGIKENRLGIGEPDAVLAQIGPGLSRVPDRAHVCILCILLLEVQILVDEPRAQCRRARPDGDDGASPNDTSATAVPTRSHSPDPAQSGNRERAPGSQDKQGVCFTGPCRPINARWPPGAATMAYRLQTARQRSTS